MSGRAVAGTCADAPSEAAPAAPDSAVSNVASNAPIGTVSPSATLTSFNVPATGDGISVFTLSVWTSTMRSYFSTASPGCFSHLPIVPSVTDSPSFGIFSSNVPIRFPPVP